MHFGLSSSCSSPVEQYLKKFSKDTQDNGDRKQSFPELVCHTGSGSAGPHAQYLSEIIPKIRGTRIRQKGGFSEHRVPSR